MLNALVMAVCYLGAAYLASALLVRFFPSSYSARQIRKNLVLVTVLPLLLVVDVLTSIDAIGRGLHAIVGRGFEVLSGRSLITRDKYSYFAYGRRRRAPRNRRRTDRSPQMRSQGTRRSTIRA
ncbi:hypothetical protein [Qipengyuania gelatinilytica]|uniref:Uncharacterized protein n=1 Tax=Qipengyuania gelatinilytica TaxID=2867231 RepID=A0ABX8ZZG3_9SPHN|nr:hypothetical protein [Qipengyuania gelatinilytica]QZD94401.1 hypothetical protein K3136_09875 [Qipengyuania gelatinilytica]